MQWVLDLFDKHKVSTRDVTDRYKAFGTGQGSIFWTGPWTLNGYVEQKLPFRTYLFPKIGEKQMTYFEMGGMELYKQADESRYEATMEAVKWLSDNSFLWTTVGRGASPRKSILDRADYKTAGHPWEVRGAFVDGMSFATEGEIPVLAGPDFTIYTGGNFLAKTLETVWAGLDQARRGDGADQGPVAARPRRRLIELAEPACGAVAQDLRAHLATEGSERNRHERRTPTARTISRQRAARDIDWAGYRPRRLLRLPFLLFNVGPVLFGVYVGFTDGASSARRAGSGSTTSAPPSPTSGSRVAFMNIFSTR